MDKNVEYGGTDEEAWQRARVEDEEGNEDEDEDEDEYEGQGEKDVLP